MTYTERRAAQPVAAQVLHARGERQGRRLDRRRGRVPPQEAAEGDGGRGSRGRRCLRVRALLSFGGTIQSCVPSRQDRIWCRLPSFLSATFSLTLEISRAFLYPPIYACLKQISAFRTYISSLWPPL